MNRSGAIMLGVVCTAILLALGLAIAIAVNFMLPANPGLAMDFMALLALCMFLIALFFGRGIRLWLIGGQSLLVGIVWLVSHLHLSFG